MPTVKPELAKRFNRKRMIESEQYEKELRAMGIEPREQERAPLPESTSRASRPDLYETFAQGVLSARGEEYGYVAGNNIADTNVMPDSRVAQNGVTRTDRGFDPHGRAERPRKRRV